MSLWGKVRLPRVTTSRIISGVERMGVTLPPEKALALRKKLAALLGGAGVTATSLAGGHAAYAAIVSFENPGPPFTFDWNAFRLLDITQPATQTTPGWNRSFYQYKYSGGGYEGVVFVGYGGNARIALSGSRVAALPSGSLVGPALTFGNYAWGAYSYYGSWYIYIGDGQREFMGVEFDLSGNTHYGWVDVMWNPNATRFDAYAWGYETDPDTPIRAGDTGDVIPEPGTLAMFAMGALAAAVALRRRKKAAGPEEE